MSILSTRWSRAGRVLLAIAFALSLAIVAPSVAHAEPDDALPGVAPPASPFEGSVSTTGDVRDVYRLHLEEGQTLWLQVQKKTVPSAETADVALFGPGTTNLDDLSSAIASATIIDVKSLLVWKTIPAGQGGDYYLSVTATAGPCAYTVIWSASSPSISLTTTDTAISVFSGSSGATFSSEARWTLYGPADPIAFTAGSNQPWLSVEPTSGSAYGNGTQTFTLHADVGALALGSYAGTVTVRILGAESTCRVALHYLKASTMSISASTLRVKYGGAVTLGGWLRDGDGVLIPATQAALQRSYDGSTWTTLTAPTSPSGSYSVTTNVDRKTYFRWICQGTETLAPCVSAEKIVQSYAYVTRPNVQSRMRPRRIYWHYGFLQPRHTAGSVAITVQWQYYSRRRWRSGGTLRVKVTDYRSYSRYLYGERYSGKGLPRKWRVRALHSDSDHLATYSSWRYYTVH